VIEDHNVTVCLSVTLLWSAAPGLSGDASPIRKAYQRFIMADDGGQVAKWAVPLVLVVVGTSCWLLREAVARFGFIALLMVVGIITGPLQACFTTAPGAESKVDLCAASDKINPAYWRRSDGRTLVECCAPLAHGLGLTPNMLTAFGLLAAIASGYNIVQGRSIIGLLLWMFGFAFIDELDGTVARKYGLCSVFGKKFDLIVDVAAHGLFGMGTLCSLHGQGSVGGFLITAASLVTSLVLQQVYDDALDLACGTEGLRAEDTALVALGFGRAQFSKREKVKKVLPHFGRFSHGLCRYVANPFAMLCYLHAGLGAQLTVLGLQLVNAACVWSGVACLRK